MIIVPSIVVISFSGYWCIYSWTHKSRKEVDADVQQRRGQIEIIRSSEAPALRMKNNPEAPALRMKSSLPDFNDIRVD